MVAGLLTGLGQGLQKAGETYGNFKMHDIQNQRQDELIQDKRTYEEGQREEEWDHEYEQIKKAWVHDAEIANIAGASKVEKGKIEAQQKRDKWMSELFVTEDGQPITRKEIIEGKHKGPVYKMGAGDANNGPKGADLNRVLKAGKEVFGEKFSLDGWNPDKKPSDGKVKTFNRILEANGMPPMEIETDPGKDEGFLWFDKERWRFASGKAMPQNEQVQRTGGKKLSLDEIYNPSKTQVPRGKSLKGKGLLAPEKQFPEGQKYITLEN